VDNGAALPVHNVVAVVSWRYQPLLAREREAREGAASGMDTAWKSGASGSVFVAGNLPSGYLVHPSHTLLPDAIGNYPES